MITVQSTPTIAPIIAAMLLLSQDSQTVVHTIIKIMYARMYILSMYVATYLQLHIELSFKSLDFIHNYVCS